MKQEIKDEILKHFNKKTEYARFLGVSRQQVNHWLNGGKPMDVKSAMKTANELCIDWLDIREDLRL